jgi:hypothetical protein
MTFPLASFALFWQRDEEAGVASPSRAGVLIESSGTLRCLPILRQPSLI